MRFWLRWFFTWLMSRLIWHTVGKRRFRKLTLDEQLDSIKRHWDALLEATKDQPATREMHDAMQAMEDIKDILGR